MCDTPRPATAVPGLFFGRRRLKPTLTPQSDSQRNVQTGSSDGSPSPAGPAKPELASLWTEHYAQLKVLARSRLRMSAQFTLLDTTDLVNQSYLRLLQSGADAMTAGSRGQFFAYASSVMRSVIVDLARERLSLRRGGGELLRLDTQIHDEAGTVDDDPLFVSEALDALQLREPRLAQIVEMRFFGGLTEIEIADALGLSERTVRRDWNKARMLMRMLLDPT